MNPHLFLIPTIAMTIVTYVSATEGGKLTCDNYILNSYLYTITYLFFMMYFVMAVIKYAPNIIKHINLGYIIMFILLHMGTLLGVLYLPKEYAMLKHIVGLLYIATASVLLSVIFFFFDSKAIISAVIMSIVLFVILSILAFNFKELISSKISIAFFIIFVIMVIAEIIIGYFYPSSLLEKAIILVVLMLICYLVLVKTKKMIENEAECEIQKGPDYVKESIGFIVSFQNILIRILQLRSGRRRR